MYLFLVTRYILAILFFIFICLTFLLPPPPSSPESVVKHFEQRDHAVDSRGVAEYIRAIVATNAIAEYLPDEESGKPSTLPQLVTEQLLLFFQLLLYISVVFDLVLLVFTSYN